MNFFSNLTSLAKSAVTTAGGALNNLSRASGPSGGSSRRPVPTQRLGNQAILALLDSKYPVEIIEGLSKLLQVSPRI